MAQLAQYKSKLLQEFENRTDDWTFGDFEVKLKELKPNSNYQDAKEISMECRNKSSTCLGGIDKIKKLFTKEADRQKEIGGLRKVCKTVKNSWSRRVNTYKVEEPLGSFIL